MPKPFLIGLTGYIGSGKDVTAALLHMIGYERHSFADFVRQEVAEMIVCLTGIPDQLAEANYELAITIAKGPHSSSPVTVDEIWTKPTSFRMRWLLQWWGTEYRRSQDPDYWIKRGENYINSLNMCVFSDVRFPNEVEMIRRKGGKIWKVQRSGAELSSSHSSEVQITSIEPDQFIANNGTLYDLAGEILKIIT